MILCDTEIESWILSKYMVMPYNPSNLQPSSIDLTLSQYFRVFRLERKTYIDPREPQELTTLVNVGKDFFMIHPGEFVLASTIEEVRIPHSLAARLDGKSSLGRIGLLVHSTAGYFDPGFRGTCTLELSNVSRLPIKLYPGMPICQTSFMKMNRTPKRLYGDPDLNSKYQNQQEPEESKYHLNYKD